MAKLRKHFDDPLLERNGRGYRLTPLGQRLHQQADRLVEQLGSMLATTHSLASPASREYVVLASDYAATVLGAPLAARLAVTAPHARLTFRDVPDLGSVDIKEVLPTVDGVVVPRGIEPPGEVVPLFSDEWCCVVDQSLAGEAARWGIDDLVARAWVATGVCGTLPARDYLRHAGVEIDVAVRAPTFGTVPWLVAGTPYVGMLHRRLAERLTVASGTAIIDVPWQQPGVHMVLFHDTLRGQDPGFQWFRDEVSSVAATLA